MNIRNRARAARPAMCFVALASLTACAETGCFVGDPVVIPASDATEPTLVLDLHGPGPIVSVTPASAPTTLTAPTGTAITLVASARDDQGVRDVQIWVRTRTCISDGDSQTCEQPTVGNPAVSNRDPGAAGDDGCTARSVFHSVTVVNTRVRIVSHEVHARGLSFGGATVRTPTVRVQAE